MDESMLAKIYEEIKQSNEYTRMLLLENKALFTKREVLQYIGYPNLNSKDVVEGFEAMNLLKSIGGKPKLYPGTQVRKLKEKLSMSLIKIPKRTEIRKRAATRQ